MKTELWPIDRALPYARNPRKNAAAVDKVAASIKEFGFRQPIVVDGDGVIVVGHTRWMAARTLGLTEVPVHVADGLTPAQVKAYRIADNRTNEEAEWDPELLAVELEDLRDADMDLALTGLDGAELVELLGAANPPGGGDDGDGAAATLAERFGVPPFSVLNAREGYWQERKKAWIALGIQSEIGRGENLIGYSDTANQYGPGASKAKNLTFVQGRDAKTDDLDPVSERILAVGAGTSIFDPVLCEIAYRWFCPPDGVVLDPFAGGSVRGVVAGLLGRAYHGVDLRGEQVAANREQAEEIFGDRKGFHRPQWTKGDSAKLDKIVPKGVRCDLLFSCPPYADLEVYSDDPADISTMAYADFLAAYREIIRLAVARMKPDSFAVWVVGEARGNDGNYYGFVPDTIRAFTDAGAALYNEAILLTSVGSAAIRAAGMFTTSRKLCKTHQNVLVFVKGDPKAATEKIGDVEFGDLAAAIAAQETTAAVEGVGEETLV